MLNAIEGESGRPRLAPTDDHLCSAEVKLLYLRTVAETNPTMGPKRMQPTTKIAFGHWFRTRPPAVEDLPTSGTENQSTSDRHPTGSVPGRRSWFAYATPPSVDAVNDNAYKHPTMKRQSL